MRTTHHTTRTCSYNTAKQQIIQTHTTQTSLYNIAIQHAIRKLSGGEIAFVKVKEGGTYMRIELRFSLYSLTKRTSRKE